VVDAVADVVGRSAVGKTALADELAEVLPGRGRTVLRATLDDLERPRRDRRLRPRRHPVPARRPR
jgi:uridine kinase